MRTAEAAGVPEERDGTREAGAPAAAGAPATLRAQQLAFADHIRDPERAPPPPGIEARRLKVYRDLFLNSLQGLLAGQFPVIRKVLGADAWLALVRDFYREHRCTTPLFPEVPREFVRYLARRAGEDRGDAPWLAELAHYESVELALDFAEAGPVPPPDAGADPEALLDGVPVLSPLAWALAYTWPVHRISPDFVPRAPPPAPTFLVVHRDAARRVRFEEASALTFRLLQRLDEAPGRTGREQLAALAGEAQATDPEAFVAEGRAMLERLHARGILLGATPPPDQDRLSP